MSNTQCFLCLDISEHNSPSPHRLRTAARGSAVSYRKALCLNCEHRREETQLQHFITHQSNSDWIGKLLIWNQHRWNWKMDFLYIKNLLNMQMMLKLCICVYTCLSGCRLLCPRVQSHSILLSGCTPPWFEPRWWPAGGWWQKGNRGHTAAPGHTESLPPSAPTEPGWRCEGKISVLKNHTSLIYCS